MRALIDPQTESYAVIRDISPLCEPEFLHLLRLIRFPHLFFCLHLSHASDFERQPADDSTSPTEIPADVNTKKKEPLHPPGVHT